METQLMTHVEKSGHADSLQRSADVSSGIIRNCHIPLDRIQRENEHLQGGLVESGLVKDVLQFDQLRTNSIFQSHL